jgi:prepilin-type N-terminal cleavage/methylation domain-containing protein
MKPTPRTSAFTLIELLVVISIIGILITIAVPNISTALTRAKMTETLANARSLQQATQMMTLDSQQSGEGYNWTTKMSTDGSASGGGSLNDYLTALTTDGYMTPTDLRKVLSAPGNNPPVNGANAENIAFSIFEISDNSPSDQVFVCTQNVNPGGGGMNANQEPYGNKGFVYFTKGGGGGMRTKQSDATSTNTFPKTTGGENAVTYQYN